MIRIKNNRLAATLAILIAFGIALPGAHASNLWIEMQPPVIENARSAMELIHFLDANTGWIETQRFSKDPVWDWLGEDEYIIMRTINGGASWRRANPPAIYHEYLGYNRKRTHFVSPTIGWKLGDDPPSGGRREAWDTAPMLMNDLEIYHTSDGGLTWQLRKGTVTKPVRNGEMKRLTSTCIHFADERTGWLIGYTDVKHMEKHMEVGNFIYSTRDGGNTWKCHVEFFPWSGADDLGLSYRRPVDIDFINREIGWITHFGTFMYRTTDGGMSWERTGHPYPIWITGIHNIEFVDESRGWAIAKGDNSGVWYTSDGGQTWTEKLSNSCLAVFADMNNVWVATCHKLPTGEWVMRILHSEDDGNTWQVEWEGPPNSHIVTYLGYHEVTQTLWAGGVKGLILKRTLPTTPVSPEGKLLTLWGELKAPRDSK